MNIKMREVVCAAALGLFAMSSHAMDSDKMHKDQYKAAVASAETDYKAARSECNAKTGNDKDVCIKEAKANLEKAKQDAKASRKSNDAMADAKHEKMEANLQRREGKVRRDERRCQGLVHPGSQGALSPIGASSGRGTIANGWRGLHSLRQRRSRPRRPVIVSTP